MDSSTLTDPYDLSRFVSAQAQILKKYYHDKPDEKTLNILRKAKWLAGND